MRNESVARDVREMARSSGVLVDGRFDQLLAALTERVTSMCAKVADRGGLVEAMLSRVVSACSDMPKPERDFAVLVVFRCASIAIEHDPFDDETPGERIHRLFKQVRADAVVS